jgi:GNAT superfamily N-acetyltransferase
LRWEFNAAANANLAISLLKDAAHIANLYTQGVSNFIVRRAKVSDWEGFYPFLEFDTPVDSLEAAFARYAAQVDSLGFFVAVQGGKIVGVAMAHVWHEYIMSGRKQIRFSVLNVHPDFRRLGIGKALFFATRDWAQSIGGTWFEWYASQSAVPFYQQLGFSGMTEPDLEHPFYEIKF